MHIKQERRCVACRTSKQQNQMLRIARANNNIIIDKTQKMGGRGAYMCLNSNCIQLTVKKHLLNRSFKSNIDELIYKSLEEYEQNN